MQREVDGTTFDTYLIEVFLRSKLKWLAKTFFLRLLLIGYNVSYARLVYFYFCFFSNIFKFSTLLKFKYRNEL